jgi:signal transduction histidine kinase
MVWTWGMGAVARRRGRLVVVAGQQLGREFIAAVFLIVALALALRVAVSADKPLPSNLDGAALVAALAGASAVLAVAGASMSIVRYRVVGDQAALRLGVALGVFALGVVIGSQLLPVLSEARAVTRWSPRLHDAAVVVTLVLLVDAVVRSTHRTRSIVAVVGWATLATAVLGVVGAIVVAATGEADDSVPVLERLAGPTGWAAGAAWFVAAIVVTLRGLHEARWLFTWFGLMAFAFASAYGLAETPTRSVMLRAVGVCLLQLLGLACAIRGGVRELEGAIRDFQRSLRWTRHELVDARIAARTGAAQLALERASQEELTHDARSVVLALQATAHVIGHLPDGAEGGGLVEALSSEIERLRRLLQGDVRGARTTFHLHDAIGPLVTTRRAGGQDILDAVGADLVVNGRAESVVEIVQNLLENAQRYAPGPVVVRARRSGDHVVLRVDDRGPGIDPAERERVFERATRGQAALGTSGSGLGLYVARRLAREHGGDLVVERRPGGGASFMLMLPAVPFAGADTWGAVR